MIVPQGIGHITKRVPALLDEAKEELPGPFRELMRRLLEHFKELDRQVSEMDHQIEHWHRTNTLSRKLEDIPGIGPVTASALIASVGDARNFANGRQLAAWLGLVPKQHSSGGKTNLQGISKRGDTYLRTLLIHGARAVIRHIERKANGQGWLGKLLGRRNKNVAAVALANKNARIAWALLAHDRHRVTAVLSHRFRRLHRQSCSDGRQVRPWLAKPAVRLAREVR